MERPIIIDNFIFCHDLDMPVLGFECENCTHLLKREEEWFCCCEENDEGAVKAYSLRELIDGLLDLLEKGESRIRKAELLNLLDQKD